MKFFMKFVLLNLFFATRLFSQAEEFGIASYYSDLFHGKPTASGELYDKDKLTAAHKTLPFGTIVKVTRLDNKKSVEVKVNDRGPFIAGRVVEISKSAAHRLDLINDGSARVSVEVMTPAAASDALANKPAEQPKEYQAPQPAIKPAPAPATTTEKTAAASDKPKETAATKAPATQPKQTAKPKETPKPAAANSDKLTAKGGTEKKMPSATTSTKGATAKTAAQPAAKLVKDQDYKQYDLYQIELRRPEKKGWGVQVAVLSSEDALFKKIAELQGDWFDNILVSVEQGKKKETTYKVILGPFDDEKSAQAYKSSLKTKKKMDGFVVSLADAKQTVKKN